MRGRRQILDLFQRWDGLAEKIPLVELMEALGGLITLHVYSPPPSLWRSYRVSDTTLADDDRLIRKPARTIRVELGHVSPIRLVSDKAPRDISRHRRAAERTAK